ncbi:DUF4124 domain-containing protein [Rugamonas apoptosis]|uniref:DUF4124 domain-containing protein n=1 Tax=Rugamonas apoptosis TaxID=2758570 RepID=A0A7W2F9V4_9BURK|nr:DUF4124 domain-containing protein [Rugamonas apoptosis]MBA5687803.1 DUF4124 domain-containing protein [Rugamonas apoptosis]
MNLTARLLLAAGLLWAAGACAQPVYKCTSADGKISYGAEPCPDGRGVVLAAPATPPSDAASDAAAQLARDKRQADGLQKARQKREQADERAYARAERAAEAKRLKCGRLQLKRQWAEDAAKTATGKAATQAQLRARHAADKLALECPAS